MIQFMLNIAENNQASLKGPQGAGGDLPGPSHVYPEFGAGKYRNDDDPNQFWAYSGEDTPDPDPERDDFGHGPILRLGNVFPSRILKIF